VTQPGDDADSGGRGDVGFFATEETDVSGYQTPVGTAADADSADAESAQDTMVDEAPADAVLAEAPDDTLPAEVPQDAMPAEVPQEAVPAEAPQDAMPAEAPEQATPAGAEAEAPSGDAAAETPLPEAQAESPSAEAASPEPSAASVISAEFSQMQDALTELGAQVDNLATATAELSRLRSRDTDLIARLHDDVTRLRSGEIAAALNPVVTGMIKLHDQMVSLGALSDPASQVGMLHTQLLQILELTCAVKPFTPDVGDRFDPSYHTGTRRRPTTDASLDGTVAGAIRAGFVRTDGSVVRVAEVEVHRLSP